MPRTLTLLLLASTFAAPPCANASAQSGQQKPSTVQTAATTEGDFERGKRLLAQGDAKGAADALKRAVGKRKTDADVWYHLGLALGHQRKAKDARKAFETALKLRPDWTDARAGLALTLLSTNKKAEAALRADPSFAAAAVLAADALLNAHVEEGMRQGRQHPVPVGASDAERKAVLALREPALAPYRTRMRELADRLEALTAARPNAPETEDWRELVGTLRHYGRPRDESGAEIFNAGQLTKKALITFKPEPGFTQEARERGVQGVVRLRAVLMPDGHVRHVIPLRRLPAGLTERCVAAARKIKFVPASINGTPVAQYVVLEYNFRIH
jgi:TonB family protein